MSVTHDLGERPLMIMHEEPSKLQVNEERCDIEGLDHEHDHEPLMSEKGLIMKGVVKHLPCGPAIMGVYALLNWLGRYKIAMETHWVIVVNTRYLME